MSTYINSSIDCCGISELADIQYSNRPEDAIIRVYKEVHNQGIILFSEANEEGSWSGMGNKICDYIREHKLGTVTQHVTCVNPNTSNYIRAYLWRVNRTNMMRWGKAFIKANPEYSHYRNHHNPWRNDEREDDY